MASSTRVKSTRKRTQFTAKQVAEMLMDSDEESIGNDDYDSSELETEEEDDESHDTQSAIDTSDGALLACVILPGHMKISRRNAITML